MQKRSVSKGLGTALLIICAGIILVPVITTLIYSFCSPTEIKQFMETRKNYDDTVFMEIKLFPKLFSLKQYYHILIEDLEILRYFINSVKYAMLIIAGQFLVIPAMAYALSRFRFPGRDTIFFLIIILMLLPFQVTMVPNVLMLRILEMMDTTWAIILPMVASPFYIFLLRQYMISLPKELIEAAQIDGAGASRCFVYIILPVCKPILGAACALSFADCWNMVEQPLTFLPSNTLEYPLSVVFNQLSQNSKGIEYAGATLYALPALFIYLFFQSDILDGIQLTEMK